ncbi:uncharacterized protein LOC119674886 [Teleopsis dalmanni]|uniref:uncharacterized protein LOC119674886 n=1 Tax=Teleopsis dalmanni TaxID=139649 RepID=UPI0018CCA293|nr:uncharacterized protein LOC119674886 [Teleopsis dalmanni]
MKYISVRVRLLQTPVTQTHVQFTIWKKANGYKPFVINTTLDMCRYFEGKKNPFFDFFFDTWKKYSNINHTCPYTSDIVVEKAPLNKFSTPTPFPEGSYRVDFMVGAYGIIRAGVQLFVTLE